MKRTHQTQLPRVKEYEEIVKKEGKRDVCEDRINKHYFEFKDVINLIKHFNINCDLFTRDYTKEEILEKENIDKGNKFVQDFLNIILKKEINDSDKVVLDKVYDYLAEEDELEEADLIFVFGGKTSLRVMKAVEVYKQGYSNKIMFSGKGPSYAEESSTTEAEWHASQAIESGVLKSNIILEKKAVTMTDNVKRSLNLLEKETIKHNLIILVNSPYSQRRGYANFQKYMNKDIKLIRRNSKMVKYLDFKNNWYKDEETIKIILNEYIKGKLLVTLNIS